MKENQRNKRRSAVLIPYRRRGDGLEIFMQRRDKDGVHFPNYLGFFGGGIEEGETSENALIREINEELEINVSGFRLLRCAEATKFGLEAYTLEVGLDFENMVKVREGQYGKFFKYSDIFKEQISDGTRIVLEYFKKIIK